MLILSVQMSGVMDLSGCEGRGIRPLGLANYLALTNYKSAFTWSRNIQVLEHGCLVTHYKRKGNLERTIQRMCERAPMVDSGKRLVSAVAIDAADAPNARYLIGDPDDIAQLWLSPVNFGTYTSFRNEHSGLHWTSMQHDHLFVPFLCLDEFHDEDCFHTVWDRIRAPIQTVYDALREGTDDHDSNRLILFNRREVDTNLWKFSFHIHFYDWRCSNIDDFCLFLQNLKQIPRKSLWTKGPEPNTWIQTASGACIFDLNVYKGRDTILRGPFCGKMDTPDTMLRPIQVTSTFDGADVTYTPIESKARDHDVVLQARVCAPTNAHTREILFGAVKIEPEDNQQQPVSMLPLQEDYMAFWTPILLDQIIPRWQLYRLSLAQKQRTEAGCSVPTLDLKIEELKCNVPLHKNITIIGDTFCETCDSHTHFDRPMQVMLDFVDLQIYQVCPYSKKQGHKMHFMGRGNISICPKQKLEDQGFYKPVGRNFHAFLLDYYKDSFVKHEDTLYVFDSTTKIWVEGEAAKMIVGEMVDSINTNYGAYLYHAQREKINRSVEAKEVLMMLQRGTNPETDEDKAKVDAYRLKKENAAKSFITKNKLFISMPATTRARLLQEIASFRCHQIVDTMDPPHLIAMKNGSCYNVYTGQVRPIQKTDRFTSYCNAQLSRDQADCKAIDDWFSEITCGNAQWAELFKRTAGYCMTHQTHDRKFYVLKGNGRNSKGLYKQFLARILEAPNSPTRWVNLQPNFWEIQKNQSAEGPSPVTASLINKTMYYTDDLTRFNINSGKLKSMVGHEPQSGRMLHSKQITFIPKGKVLWTTNNFPKIPGDDLACWERYVLLLFLARYVEEPKPDRFEYKQDQSRYFQLLEKSDAFFTLCLEALTRYYRTLMLPGQTTPQYLGPMDIPLDLIEARRLARHDAFPMAQFVDERLEIRPTAWVDATVAFDAFLDFLHKKNYTRQDMNFQAFQEQLTSSMDITIQNGVLFGYGLKRADECRDVRLKY